jgi:hypothetical protein
MLLKRLTDVGYCQGMRVAKEPQPCLLTHREETECEDWSITAE